MISTIWSNSSEVSEMMMDSRIGFAALLVVIGAASFGVVATFLNVDTDRAPAQGKPQQKIFVQGQDQPPEIFLTAKEISQHLKSAMGHWKAKKYDAARVAFEKVQRGAEKESAQRKQASAFLCNHHFLGLGVPKNYEIAYHYCTIAAFETSPWNMFIRGRILTTKSFSRYDRAQGVKLLKMAAAKGDASAKKYLASLNR